MPFSVLQSNNIKDVTAALIKHFGTSGYISIDKQLVSALVKKYENLIDFNSLKCNNLGPCPKWWRSVSDLERNLNIIGNISKSTGLLILNGENDSQNPVEQAFLLQQRLTDINHPDHILITS